jgi:N-carbamoyl-L-amino-acid hydrolase
MPAVMLFVKSLKGLSHTKEEDTPEGDLELSVRALHQLAVRTMDWVAAEQQGRRTLLGNR